jgi:putative endonuclease
MEKNPCVYMLASKKEGTLYIGVTSDLIKRVWEHRNEVTQGFTKNYGVHFLVWYEQHPTMESAIKREKTLKTWLRAWKIHLINKSNPTWKDLYEDLIDDGFSARGRGE